ncbi:hypothetical protein BBAD15_g9063 [Beauveria bassiana D1-5]|uniref:Infection structure specific protein n=1 Tax=Beauveria bassiana D1-5 TaxID=1245745 RepID=A0A0A2VHW8_BEABA|nr:hypothetical protein BBAD15_g9063 [Beauveria bassiana D1-5]
MRVHALSALSLAGLATTAAADQLDARQQTIDQGSFACLTSIMALVQASPTIPAALSAATDDCVPSSLTAAASSFTSDAKAWYTSLLSAATACPAWPSESTIPDLDLDDIVPCTGQQPSSAATAAATTTSASGNAVATSANPTKSSTSSVSSAAASGTGSAATTSARSSSAASGSAGRSATTSSSQSANAAARETGVVFAAAAVAMAALGAAAL